MKKRFRCLFIILVTTLGCTNDYEVNPNQETDPPTVTKQGWVEKAPIPTPRIAMGLCLYENKLYTFGGYDGTSVSNKLEVYDIMSDSWEVMDPIPTKRGFTATCTIGNKIIIIGGTQYLYFTNVLTLVEEYNPASNSWITKAEMPTARAGSIFSHIDNKIYVISGRTGYLDQFHQFPKTNVVEMYDPFADDWIAKTSIPNSRAHTTAAVVNGKIYVIGGELYQRNQIVECYDPATDKWERKADLPDRGYHNCISVSLNDKIYVFGGSLDIEKDIGTTTLFEYTPSEDSWRKLPDIPQHITIGNAIAVRNKIYILGTATGPWPLTPLSKVYEFDPVLYLAN